MKLFGSLKNQVQALFKQTSTPATPPSGSASVFLADDQGRSVLQMVDATGAVINLHRDSTIMAKNESGGTITKGQPVYFSSATPGQVRISLAHAGGLATAAAGIAYETISNNTFGRILLAGDIPNVNTSAYTQGDKLYLSTTPGALTSTPPANIYVQQYIGLVLVSNASTGRILVDLGEPSLPAIPPLSDVLIAGNTTGPVEVLAQQGVSVSPNPGTPIANHLELDLSSEFADTFSSVNSGTWLGQQFLVTTEGITEVTSVDVYTSLNTGTGELRAQIWSLSGGLPDAVMATSDPLDENSLTDNGISSFTNFDAQVSLTVGESYAVVIEGSNVTSGSYRVYRNSVNPYPDGEIVRTTDAGSSWATALAGTDLLVSVYVTYTPQRPGLLLLSSDDSYRRVGVPPGSDETSFILPPAAASATGMALVVTGVQGEHDYVPLHRVEELFNGATLSNSNSHGIASTTTVLAFTGGGAFTVTLPPDPHTGDVYIIVDASGAFHTDNLTIDGNSNNLRGSASPLVVSTQHAIIHLVYTGEPGYGWAYKF